MSFNQPEDATPETTPPTDPTLASPTDVTPDDELSSESADAIPVATLVPSIVDPDWASHRRRLRMFQIPLVVALLLLCVQAARVSMARFGDSQGNAVESTDASVTSRPAASDPATNHNTVETNTAVASVATSPLTTGPDAKTPGTEQPTDPLLHGLIVASGHDQEVAAPPTTSVALVPETTPDLGNDSPMESEVGGSLVTGGSILDAWDVGEAATPWTLLGQTLASSSHSRHRTVDRIVDQAAGAAVRLAARVAHAEQAHVASSLSEPVTSVAPSGNAAASSAAPQAPATSQVEQVEQPVKTTDAAPPNETGTEPVDRPREPEGLTLINPPRSGGSISFLLDGKPVTLAPGETRELPPGRSWDVRFHRGGAFGTATHVLQRGTHVFTVTREGWKLVPSRSAGT